MMKATIPSIARRAAPDYAETSRRDPAFLSVDGLCKYYTWRSFGGSRPIKSLDGVTLRVAKGEIMGIVGESGCGKSTLAKVVTRLTSATAGQITLDGEDWLAPRGEALRRRRPQVQLVFQDPHGALDPRMTIGTAMAAPMAAHGIGTPADRRDRVLAMLAEVGLDESFHDRLPAQCSGGQLQRVVIGRALLLEPQLLVCDEPTSALDASMRTQILNLLMDLRARRGLTMLMISHDLRVVRYMCDRIAVMYAGQVVELADRDHLFDHPAHPYTRALIASSLLEPGGIDLSRHLREGEVPSPLAMPEGCRFASRCPYAQPDCTALEPALKQAGSRHFVRCRHWNTHAAATMPPRG
ncbi:ABC transporter ATP-binding protein [Tabrizicola sp. TH137]|uniref:ABC transporter ATP-binding protein n=1 Tax=Tabrizicola sp. TH137 TaxID=2067452 RepID=UPI001C1FDC25|nr:ABC transporter ATP-binding protein [Tabrizicola sp. TH137]